MSLLIDKFKKHKSSIKRIGLLKYFKKHLNKINYLAKRINKNSKNNKMRWLDLRNKFEGERVFLIGNGPSLNKTPLYLLKNEYKMCFNRFYLMLERLNWNIDFFLTVDNLVLNDLLDELEIVMDNSKYLFMPDIHFRGEEYYKQIQHNNKIYWIHHKVTGEGFSKNLPKVYGGGSVIYEGLQILNYLGFKEIILIGVDMNYKIHNNVNKVNNSYNDIESKADDDPNHFDPRYFGKGRKYHQPNSHVVDRIFKSLEYVSKNMDDLGFNVINAGYDSEVEFFDKYDLCSYLDVDKYDIKILFDDCVNKQTKYNNLEEMINDIEQVEQISHARAMDKSFSVNLSDGLNIIKEKVFTHKPIGPFDAKYYFIRRE